MTDRGNVTAPIRETKACGNHTKKYIREISRVCQRLYETTLQSLDEGPLPIVLEATTASPPRQSPPRRRREMSRSCGLTRTAT